MVTVSKFYPARKGETSVYISDSDTEVTSDLSDLLSFRE